MNTSSEEIPTAQQIQDSSVCVSPDIARVADLLPIKELNLIRDAFGYEDNLDEDRCGHLRSAFHETKWTFGAPGES